MLPVWSVVYEKSQNWTKFFSDWSLIYNIFIHLGLYNELFNWFNLLLLFLKLFTLYFQIKLSLICGILYFDVKFESAIYIIIFSFNWIESGQTKYIVYLLHLKLCGSRRHRWRGCKYVVRVIHEIHEHRSSTNIYDSTLL